MFPISFFYQFSSTCHAVDRRGDRRWINSPRFRFSSQRLNLSTLLSPIDEQNMSDFQTPFVVRHRAHCKARVTTLKVKTVAFEPGICFQVFRFRRLGSIWYKIDSL